MFSATIMKVSFASINVRNHLFYNYMLLLCGICFFIIQHHLAKYPYSYIKLTVINIKVWCMMSLRFVGILSFWHTTKKEKESGCFITKVRKIFTAGSPFCFHYI